MALPGNSGDSPRFGLEGTSLVTSSRPSYRDKIGLFRKISMRAVQKQASTTSPTLSESAPSSPHSPCKSPDCPADRAPNPFGSKTTLFTLSLVPGIPIFFCAFFPDGYLFAAAFSSHAFFGDRFLAPSFSPCLLLFVFLGAICEVYTFLLAGCPRKREQPTLEEVGWFFPWPDGSSPQVPG